VSGWEVRFPPDAAGEQLELAWADGRVERLHLHDYARIYQVPGLYEEVVQRRLRCATPAVLAEMLAGAAPPGARVLDLGAGTGASGEALAAAGLRPAVAVDVLPEARAAALRDRPGLYERYLVADLRAPDPEAAAALRAARLDALACSGAVGGGHVPIGALRAALDLLAPGAHVALSLHAAGAGDPDVRGVAELVREGRVHEVGRRRYRHRLTTRGEELMVTALVLAVAS
jgi:SAM-dependent methyltransferase